MLERNHEPFAVGALILAAGASRRMGRPKLLLPWGKTSVFERLLQQSETLSAHQVAIVCAVKAQPMMDELNRVGFSEANRIFNPTPELGMFSSVQCAANWTGWSPELTHFLIMLGDQPHLLDDTLRTLMEFARRNPDKICQPMRHGHRKHPVILPKRVFLELKNTSAGDLKIVLNEHAKDLSGFECADAGLDFDMDTPEDYERLRDMYGPG